MASPDLVMFPDLRGDAPITVASRLELRLDKAMYGLIIGPAPHCTSRGSEIHEDSFELLCENLGVFEDAEGGDAGAVAVEFRLNIPASPGWT